jgi:hypothetical protein
MPDAPAEAGLKSDGSDRPDRTLQASGDGQRGAPGASDNGFCTLLPLLI